jgi:hypothetical protein
MIVGALVVLVMNSCQPGTPSQYIQPDDMEDILVDYFLARGMSDNAINQTGEGNYIHGLYIESVLKKHGVTQAEFDSSLVYYYTRADRFEAIYNHVAERLEAQALVLGASEGDIGKYASLDATGDTANIWTDRPHLLLLTMPPYNRRNIEVNVDSTFRRRDSFLFQFMSDFMYQDGARTAVAYVAFEYTDTVITKVLRISTSGLNQMRVYERDADLVSIKGYFFAGEGAERSTTTRMLFLDNIQFIRFHKEEVVSDNEDNQKDSVSSDTIARRVEPAVSGSRDRGVGSIEVVPLDTGNGKHRMVERGHHLER